VGLVFPTRGSAVVARLTHAQEVAGSIPAPAIEPSAAAIRASIERGTVTADEFLTAMSRGFNARERVGGTAPAASAARADEAVRHDAHGADAQFGVVASDSNRDDPAGMEHVRQSRLSRWQRLPAA
jgi:hypothetical protein